MVSYWKNKILKSLIQFCGFKIFKRDISPSRIYIILGIVIKEVLISGIIFLFMSKKSMCGRAKINKIIKAAKIYLNFIFGFVLIM